MWYGLQTKWISKTVSLGAQVKAYNGILQETAVRVFFACSRNVLYIYKYSIFAVKIGRAREIGRPDTCRPGPPAEKFKTRCIILYIIHAIRSASDRYLWRPAGTHNTAYTLRKVQGHGLIASRKGRAGYKNVAVLQTNKRFHIINYLYIYI